MKSKIWSFLRVASAAFFVACTPALAQTSGTVSNHAVAIGKGPGVTGFGSALPGAVGSILTSNGASADPTFKPSLVYNVADYASVQAAVDAAKAANGGVVVFGCQDYTLASGAVGLNVASSNNITLRGPLSQNGGGLACGALRYTGTGTAIDAGASVGFRIDGLEIVASNAATVIELGNAAQASFAIIEKSTIIGKATTGIGISIYNTISSTIRNNTIGSGIGIKGARNLTDVSNQIDIIGNTFLAGNNDDLQNAVGWLVIGNTFETPVGHAYGQSGTTQCFNLNFTGNFFSDPSVGQTTPWIEASCYSLHSTSNEFAAQSGQTIIKVTNSSGTLVSTNDVFESANIAIDIGTGNYLALTGYKVGPPGPVTTLISGTPATVNPVQYLYGPQVINGVLTLGIPGTTLGVAKYSGSTSGTVTVQAQAVAGTPTIVWPNTSGTVVTSATSPLSVNATTGAVSLSLSTASNSLAANVLLNNTANYFDGPSMAQGTIGTWYASGTATLTDATTASFFHCKLWDGATVIASSNTQLTATGGTVTPSLSGILANPAGNIRISCKDTGSVNGSMLSNNTSNGKDSTITGIRLN